MTENISFYTTEEGYLHPNIQISNNPQDDRPLGTYGRLAMTYLQEKNPIRFSELQIEGTLMAKMHEVDQQAKEQILDMMDRLKKQQPVPQTEDIFEKTKYMNQLKQQAEEIVLKEFVYQTR
ncbi:TnpV protein [Metabacillus fastidiosus]|uniref:TnpV protein n=1 Tax=Metabacillus fastidiosus TaxID=1458 RepID=UPI002E1B79DB|nr:TnpV protein [Metabacillus fastidiosus]